MEPLLALNELSPFPLTFISLLAAAGAFLLSFFGVLWWTLPRASNENCGLRAKLEATEFNCEKEQFLFLLARFDPAQALALVDDESFAQMTSTELHIQTSKLNHQEFLLQIRQVELPKYALIGFVLSAIATYLLFSQNELEFYKLALGITPLLLFGHLGSWIALRSSPKTIWDVSEIF